MACVITIVNYDPKSFIVQATANISIPPLFPRNILKKLYIIPNPKNMFAIIKISNFGEITFYK